MVRIICRIINFLVKLWRMCQKSREHKFRGGYIYLSWWFGDSSGDWNRRSSYDSSLHKKLEPNNHEKSFDPERDQN